MTKSQEIKMPINVKCLIFLYFQYKKNENARTEQQIDIKTLLCIDRGNASRISRIKTPSPRCKDNQNENMMRGYHVYVRDCQAKNHVYVSKHS
jgi:hypothetical protein